MCSRQLIARWSLFTLLIIGNTTFAAAQQAGLIEFARGAATAQRSDEPARIIGQGQAFFQGEVLSTSRRSFAVIRLDDGSRLTLRPNTQFVVENINADKSTQANAVLRLFKGGVRAVTGFISKYNKSGYKLETPIATMGIRGTEFDARLCEGDCDKNETAETNSLQSARIAFARGQLTLAREGGGQQPIETGSTVNHGEKLTTGHDGLAVLVFPDDSRITLQPGSEFIIRSYRYSEDHPETSESILELLRGGLRAVTGLIGKFASNNYRMHTPVATIGIRGTGFDLLCKGDCADSQQTQWQPERILDRLFGFLMRSAYAQSLPKNGMYAYVWSGGIEIGLRGREFSLNEGQSAFISKQIQKPIMLPHVPGFLLKNPYQRPDKLVADPKELFSKKENTEKTKTGLYVSVYDGEIEIDKTRLKKGDSSFTDVNNRTTQRLDAVPAFMLKDSFPKPSDFKPSVYRLLDTLENPQEKFECEL